jgi:hypothetical protein
MLVGRLQNCGFCQSHLAEVFAIDPKSVRRYAKALQDGSPEAIQRISVTRAGKEKLTPEIGRFAIMRYHELRNTTKDYRQVILMQVEKVFEVKVSGESLRLLWKDDEQAMTVSAASTPTTTSVESPQDLPKCATDWPAIVAKQSDESRATTCDLPSRSSENEPAIDKCRPEVGAPKATLLLQASAPKTVAAPAVERAKPCLPLSHLRPPSQPTFLHHAGSAVFWPLLDLVRPGMDHPLAQQWISQILQGAVNIEQTRDLQKDHLGCLVGPVYGRSAQREGLAELARPEKVMAAYKCNARLLGLGPQDGRFFYYDPHTKEYTGACKILKGWCGRRHSIGKVLHMDFIHTENGHPCFSQCYDNYYDLRERFLLTLEQFEQLRWGINAPPHTWIVDRGIYGKDAMAAIVDRGHHLITWEKGYKRDGWQYDHPSRSYRIERACNDSRTHKTWHFQAQEHAWHGLPNWRKIIVRASNPSGNSIEVSILCSDPEVSVGKIIDLMFNRWLQENDFGILDRHYGMQQITSYRSASYAKIARELRDREIDPAEYKVRRKACAKARCALADLVLGERQCAAQISDLSAEYDRVLKQLKIYRQWCSDHAQALNPDASSRERDHYARVLAEQAHRIKRAHALKTKLAKLRQKQGKLSERIIVAERVYSEAEHALYTAVRSRSRLGLLLAENYSRLDTGCKLLMDALRVTARNIFAMTISHFRGYYDNLRDDHAILRLVTQSPGWVHYDGRQLCVALEPRASFSKKQVSAVNAFLESMGDKMSVHFTDKYPPVRIALREAGSIWDQI